MKDRIKQLRKSLNITQQEFAERIGVKRNTIGQYEIGRNEPIDAIINLICREFNVNEKWLRTGEGEMFKAEPSDALEQLAQEYHLSNADYILILKFISLRPELRNKLFDFFREVISTVDAENSYEKTYTEVTEEETTAAAEAAYRKSLHSAKNTVSIVSSTIEDTGTNG